MDRNSILGIIALIVLAALGGFAIKKGPNTNYSGNFSTTTPYENLGSSTPIGATSTPATSTPRTPTTPQFHAYGNVTLSLGQKVVYPGGYLKILSVTEDSRCPVDVKCIQAGTVKIKIEYQSGSAIKTTILELAKSFIRGDEKIIFSNVSPTKYSGKTISPASYRFVLNVSKVVKTSSTAPCYVGGCSREICSSQQGVVSACIYKAQYACYKTATCERQSNGQCGWTQTPELKSCLANAG